MANNDRYKKLLPQRIPEYNQSDDNLREYLEVAGELMDEFAATIDSFKDFKDYAKTPEDRLRTLARDFAMEFPRNLDEETQRQIIRDISDIYSRVGMLEVINWTFRIIGWEIDLEYAWLPNPENYDSSIIDRFRISDYGLEQTPTEIIDFFRSDFRSFLIGEEYVDDDGVYFRGRQFFDTEQTIDKLEIVGEYYKEIDKTRTADKVAKTPYVFIRVSDDTYNKFLLPYVDQETGEVFSYTDLEIFRVIENILKFFVFEDYRPTHTRVVIIVSTQLIDDNAVISETFEAKLEPKPLEMEDDSVITVDDFSRLDHTITAGEFFLTGAPPSPFGRKMVIAPIKNEKLFEQSGEDHIFEESLTDGIYVQSLLNEQPQPFVNTNEFSFYTPDRESFTFRKVMVDEDAFLSAHYETGTGATVDSDPYPDDDDSIRLNFDMVTNSFGIIDALKDESIIVREPSQITSPNFLPINNPANAYVVGVPDGSGGFEDNTLLEFDFVDEDYQADEGVKTFTYSYDIHVFTKEAVQDTAWVESYTALDQNTLLNMVDFNEVLFVPQTELGFDLVLETTYLPQPEWENDPRGNS